MFDLREKFFTSVQSRRITDQSNDFFKSFCFKFGICLSAEVERNSICRYGNALIVFSKLREDLAPHLRVDWLRKDCPAYESHFLTDPCNEVELLFGMQACCLDCRVDIRSVPVLLREYKCTKFCFVDGNNHLVSFNSFVNAVFCNQVLVTLFHQLIVSDFAKLKLLPSDTILMIVVVQRAHT